MLVAGQLEVPDNLETQCLYDVEDAVAEARASAETAEKTPSPMPRLSKKGSTIDVATPSPLSNPGKARKTEKSIPAQALFFFDTALRAC